MIRELIYGDTPPSLNQVGSRGAPWAYRAAKKRWQATISGLLLESGLPHGLEHVHATAILLFPVDRKRDEGNYRWLLEKALGDALQPTWLDDDTPERFTFGAVTFGHGPACTRLRLETTP